MRGGFERVAGEKLGEDTEARVAESRTEETPDDDKGVATDDEDEPKLAKIGVRTLSKGSLERSAEPERQ